MHLANRPGNKKNKMEKLKNKIIKKKKGRKEDKVKHEVASLEAAHVINNETEHKICEGDLISTTSVDEGGLLLASSENEANLESTEGTEGGKKKFRFYAKQLFLTYPRINLKAIHNNEQREELLNLYVQLENKMKKRNVNIEKYILGIEAHVDGTPHLHIYLRLTRKLSISDPHELDLLLEKKVCHGNYQGVKSRESVIDYITKYNNFVTNMDIREGREITFREKLVELVRQRGLKEALEELTRVNDAKLITKEFKSIVSNLTLYDEFIHPKYEKPVYDLETFMYPKGVLEWLQKESASKTLVLTGPSGVGKTEGLLALLDHLGVYRITEKNQLKDIPSNAKAILMDDLDFQKFSWEELIHLFEVRRKGTIRVLYGVAILDSGLIRI